MIELDEEGEPWVLTDEQADKVLSDATKINALIDPCNKEVLIETEDFRVFTLSMSEFVRRAIKGEN